MPHGIPDTRQFPWDQALSNNLQQLTNKVTGGINTWAVNPTVGVDGLALGANHVGYSGINTTESSLVRWDGTAWATLMDGDKVVTATQLSVYVNQATGNDNNDGRTASTAWKTISKFYQEVNKYAINGKQVNLYLGAGTYIVEFPSTLDEGRVHIIGQSSATVTIQWMNVTKGITVILQGVTLAYPEVVNSTIYYWIVNVSSASLVLGSDVVLGSVGTFLGGTARFHAHLVDSTLSITAGTPVTLTGSVTSLFVLRDSKFNVSTFYAPSAGVVSPNAAPSVNKGFTYTGVRAPTSSDTVAVINATGNISVTQLMIIDQSAVVNGPPLWRLQFTGTISGAAYALTKDSSINGYVSKSAVTMGIQFPTSISSGTKDISSTVLGTEF